LRYQWELIPGKQDAAILHVDRYLSARRASDGSSLEERIRDIPGVVELSVGPYSVAVNKGRLFPWDSIKPVIVGLVGDACDPGGEHEIAL
jgi:hypothetical protein